MSEYGNRLKKIRIELGFTQAQMGDLLGVTQGEISRHERGERQLTQDIILMLNEKKNVNILYLIRGEPPIFENSDQLHEPSVAYRRAPLIRVPGLGDDARIWQKKSSALSPVITLGDYVIGTPTELSGIANGKIYIVETDSATYIRYAQQTGKQLLLLANDRASDPILIEQKAVQAIYEVRLRLTADLLPRVTGPDLESSVKKIEDFLTNMIDDEEE